LEAQNAFSPKSARDYIDRVFLKPEFLSDANLGPLDSSIVFVLGNPNYTTKNQDYFSSLFENSLDTIQNELRLAMVLMAKGMLAYGTNEANAPIFKAIQLFGKAGSKEVHGRIFSKVLWINSNYSSDHRISKSTLYNEMIQEVLKEAFNDDYAVTNLLGFLAVHSLDPSGEIWKEKPKMLIGYLDSYDKIQNKVQLKSHPLLQSAKTVIGLLYENAGLYQKSVDLFEELINESSLTGSTNNGYYYNQAIAYARMKNYDEAIVTLKKAALSEPIDSNLSSTTFAYRYSKLMADLYKSVGKLDSAIIYYEKVVAYQELSANLQLENKRIEADKTFEVLKRQEEISYLKLQNDESEKRLWLSIKFGTVLIIAILGILILYLRVRKINSKLNELIKSRDSLIEIIAHDLRSPLRMYQGLAQSLQLLTRRNDIERINAVGAHIDSVGQSIDLLLSNMLSWGIAQQGHSFNARVYLVLEEIVKPLREPYELIAFGKSSKLEILVEDDLTGIGDEAAISIITRNLLDNALKFCEPNDIVKCNLSIKNKEFFISVSNKTDVHSFRKLRMIVQDIRQSQKERKSVSSGMGWALISQLVVDFNGTITIDQKDDTQVMSISIRFHVR